MLWNNDFGADDGMTMAGLQGAYGGELIEMISVQTDSGAGSAGLMDGLIIRLTDEAGAHVGHVDFSNQLGAAVVPTPSAALGGLAMMGLISLRRRH